MSAEDQTLEMQKLNELLVAKWKEMSDEQKRPFFGRSDTETDAKAVSDGKPEDSLPGQTPQHFPIPFTPPPPQQLPVGNAVPNRYFPDPQRPPYMFHPPQQPFSPMPQPFRPWYEDARSLGRASTDTSSSTTPRSSKISGPSSGTPVPKKKTNPKRRLSKKSSDKPAEVPPPQKMSHAVPNQMHMGWPHFMNGPMPFFYPQHPFMPMQQPFGQWQETLQNAPKENNMPKICTPTSSNVCGPSSSEAEVPRQANVPEPKPMNANQISSQQQMAHQMANQQMMYGLNPMFMAYPQYAQFLSMSFQANQYRQLQQSLQNDARSQSDASSENSFSTATPSDGPASSKSTQDDPVPK